jgi:hypothetical protein
MTFLRGVAVLLLVSGVAIGTLSDRRPPIRGDCFGDWIAIFRRARGSERGVLEAFRHGPTLAADTDGHLYGDPSLIALFEQQRAGRSPSAEDGWRVSALAAVWAGLLGLVLFGGRGDTTDGSPCPAPPARGQRVRPSAGLVDGR